MRLCCFSLKGGVGRTTMALNLAGCYARDPRLRVLVNDRDPQGGASAFAALSDETPFSVGRSRSPGFSIEITDTPPRLPDNEVIPEADLYLVPTLLDGASFLIFLRTVELLEKKGKRYLPIANRANEKRASHRRRLEHPKMAGAVLVRDRALIADCYEQGQTIFETSGRWTIKAQEEIHSLAVQVHYALTAGAHRGAAA